MYTPDFVKFEEKEKKTRGVSLFYLNNITDDSKAIVVNPRVI